MGNMTLKQGKCTGKKSNRQQDKPKQEKKFVLSDVSKEELDKRRIPVYSYLL